MGVRRSTKALIFSLTFIIVSGYSKYKNLIPNGHAVPNPCLQNSIWEGVGHFWSKGGSWQNQFGLDFKDAGKEWTKSFCLLDSDGDGMTNGEELGDPDCVWKPGAEPARKEHITHPGICDPWDAQHCLKMKTIHPEYKTQEMWLKQLCDRGEKLQCGALKEKGVSSFDVKLSQPVLVPNKVTTHMMQILDAPKGDLHIIAYEPALVNPEIVHHIAIYGCFDHANIPTIGERSRKYLDLCIHYILGWSVGNRGLCFPPDAGLSVGQNSKGFKKIAIEIHYHNPDLLSGIMDDSGLKFYYTAVKRQYDTGVLMIGSSYFVLPPGQPETSVVGRCTADCTKKKIKDKIYISGATNHMHVLGAAMSIELRRNGSHFVYLTNQPEFDYNNPYLIMYNPVIEMLPGDELVTTCVFDTRSTNISHFYGEQIFDEMCLGFVQYYPTSNFLGLDLIDCLAHADILPCDPETYAGCPDIYEMASPAFVQSMSLFHDAALYCEEYGPCRKECIDAQLEYREKSQCLEGKYALYLKGYILQHEPGRELMARLASCDVEVNRILNANLPESSDNSKTGAHSSAPNPQISNVFSVFAMMLLMVLLK